MYTYRMHGCVVESDLDLHLPVIDADSAPAMILRQSSDLLWTASCPDQKDVIATIWNEPPGLRYYLARTPGGYRLHFDAIGEFDISADLVDVSWKMAPGQERGLISVLASGSLMAFRLSLAGHLVLHASAVRVRDRGLAFVGRCGMGKSTVATMMCGEGAELLTDDVARVDLDGLRPMLWPGCVESRLRPDATSIADDSDSRGLDVRMTGDGRTAVSLPFWDKAPVSLDAVVIPIPSRDHDELHLTEVSSAKGLAWMGRYPRIAGWTDNEMRAREFTRLAALARCVPVYIAVLPWGLPFPARIADDLLTRLGW